MSADRVYWSVGRSWHALSGTEGYVIRHALCGRKAAQPECRDRIPPTAHLCGNCARIIAARTDIEFTGAPV